MKSPLLLFFTLAILSSATVTSQTVLNTSFRPAVGQIFEFRVVDTIGVTEATAGPAGPSITWSLGGLFITLNQFNYNWVTPATTPYVGNFPGANLASSNSISTYEFYNDASGTFNFMGSQNGADFSKYGTAGAALFDFPFEYGDSTVVNFTGGSFSSGTLSGKVVTHADAFGTLQLSAPIGNVTNALRVKRTETLLYNYGPGVDDTVRTTTYLWYRSQCKEPVLIMGFKTSTFGQPEKYVRATAGCVTITSVRDQDLLQGIEVFPNPASNYFTINANGISIEKVEVVDLNGRILITANTPDLARVDVASLATGSYQIKLQTAIGTANKYFVKL